MSTKKRQGAEASCRRSKKPRAEEEEAAAEPWDFSQWAWQDTEKAPLPSSASSGGPMVRWLGVKSLASIVLGREGKVYVADAVSKRRLQFEMRYVEGWQRATHTVLPLEAPRAVADLFSSKVAKQVLETPSFLQRLCEAGGHEPSLRQNIEEVLAELNVYTPAEHASLVSFFKICGGAKEGKLPLRAARVQGQLVMALIDAVMLAKKCSYAAAQSICHRMLLDYWQFDMEKLESNQQATVPADFFRVRLQSGLAGQATLCVTAAVLAEVLILIPGCELSSQLRRDMVQSFFGVGGSQVTFESLLANGRIQAHLRGCADNPLVEVLQDREHKDLVRKLPRIIESFQNALQERDEGLRQLLRQRDDSLWQAAGESFFDALGKKLATFMQMSLAGHVSKVVGAAVRDAFALKKAQPKKASKNSVEMPEDQRATPAETGPLSLPLSCVATDVIPDLPFFVWKEMQLGSSFGRRAKAERLRRHDLGAAHPDFVAKPLLWSFTGGLGGVEGGGSRYIYLRRDYAMLRKVFCTPMVTTAEQRRAGAPRPTESLEQRARRLAAGLTAAQRAVDWPIHVAEIEPSWPEMKAAEA